MTDRLYLFAPALAAEPWRFCLHRSDGAWEEGQGLDTAAAAGTTAPGPVATWLILPAEQLLRTAVEVPARGRRQIEMAVPYLVEEFLAEDVEGLHLAMGQRQSQGRVPVVAIDPGLLQGYLDAVHEYGMEVDHAHAVVEGLLGDTAPMQVLIYGDSAWLGCQGTEGVVIDRGLLLQAMSEASSRLDAAEDAPLAITLRLPADDQGLDLAELDSALGQIRPVAIERQPFEHSLIREWSGLLANHAGIDLLQGRFARPGRDLGSWRRWRLVAGLAVTWLLLHMGFDVTRSAWLEQRAVALREESLSLFQDIYPERTRVPDPRRELEALLGDDGGSGGGAFLDLLGASAARMAAIDAGPVQLRSITFNAQRGDLALELTAAGIDAVDRFKAGMEEQGYPVVIDSAVQEAQAVRARVRVRSGGTG